MPKLVQRELHRVSGNGHKARVLAFVTENCVACQHLLASLPDPLPADFDAELVIVAKDASPEFMTAIEKLGHPTLFDEGELWNMCEVTATPLVVRLDEDGRVEAKEVSHNVVPVNAVD